MPSPHEADGGLSLHIARSMAGLAALGGWVDRLTAALGLDAATEYAVRLCAEEAAANVVMHGVDCAGDGDGVTLRVAVMPDGLDLVIEDRCAPFDPLTVPVPPLPRSVADAQVGGMGIHLMRHYARHVSYERAGTVNRLTLRIGRKA